VDLAVLPFSDKAAAEEVSAGSVFGNLGVDVKGDAGRFLAFDMILTLVLRQFSLI